MKSRLSLIWFGLLLTFALPLDLAAQEAPSQELRTLQARFTVGGIQPDCLQRPASSLPGHGLAPLGGTHPCKPVLAGTEATQLSNELPRHDDNGTYITFDVPGSSSTSVSGINLTGTIAGSYCDAVGCHGFLRRLNGAFTTFDVPGSSSTSVSGINLTGTTAGSYCDTAGCHGFLRTLNGAFTTFDVPGTFDGPYVTAINDAGVITGAYFDENFVSHSFLRSPNGTITTFDAPGAVYGTISWGINLEGATTGFYFDEDFVDHGFVRSRSGDITTFDILGLGTDAYATSLLGTVTGQFNEDHPEVHFHLWRGFIRKVDGTIETFDAVPSPLDPCCTWTTPSSINLFGEIVGTDNDAHGVNHGFLRARDENITILDAPGSGPIGTIAVSINQLGVIAGYYYDVNNVTHGFLWIRH